jgi:diguanylate cyclase (GGDEF)-like protein/PAS domain S-box-containing protein
VCGQEGEGRNFIETHAYPALHARNVTGDSQQFISGVDAVASLEGAPDAMVVIAPDLSLTWANAAAETLFGVRRSDRLFGNVVELVHPEDLALVTHAFATVHSKPVGTPLEVRVATSQGWRLVEIVGRWVPELGDQGSIVAAMRDLTDRRKWDLASGADERLRRLVDHADVITFLVDVEGLVTSHSPALTRRLGHDPEAVQGYPLTNLIDEEQRDLVARIFQSLAGRHDDGVVHREVIEVGLLSVRRPESVPYELTIVDLHDDPIVCGYVVTAHDVSRLRTVRRALEHQAMHDELTELGNRRLLMQQLAEWHDHDVTYAIAFIDIDRFKPVNDLFGHESGDRVLRTLSGRLVDAMERYRNAVVVRLSGDEFVVAVPVDPETAELACANVLATVSEVFDRAIYLPAGPINLTGSIGVSTGDGHESVEEVIARADDAMYLRKRESRGGPPMTLIDNKARRELAEELVGAIDRDEIVVHYQPIVDLLTREVDGVEALVRWNHPTSGLLAPGAFLSIAQDIGLDADLDRYVLKVAATAVAQRIAEYGRDFKLTVNISAPHLVDVTTPDYVADVLRSSGLKPELLWLEITEHAVLQRSGISASTTTLTAFQRLEQMGVRIAIDDFGTGFSSLSSLMNYPIKMVKIDQSFVGGFPSDQRSAAMVESLLTLGKRMGIVTVAEGIERVEQLDELVELGCRLGQGYLLGRPSPYLPGELQGAPMRVLRSLA